jgi:hypothetical protein
MDETNVIIIHEIQSSIHFHPPIDPSYSHQLGDGNGWIIEFHENNIFLIYIVKRPKLFVKAKQCHSCFILTPLVGLEILECFTRKQAFMPRRRRMLVDLRFMCPPRFICPLDNKVVNIHLRLSMNLQP